MFRLPYANLPLSRSWLATEVFDFEWCYPRHPMRYLSLPHTNIISYLLFMSSIYLYFILFFSQDAARAGM